MRRIMLTGASGFLGGNFCHFHGDEFDIHGLYYSHYQLPENIHAYPCDLRDEAAVSELIDRIRPDAIIHLAALSQPNDCAENPELSYSINVAVSVHLARLANERNIPFVFTSTEQVFDGEHAPYAENDTPQPANLYGEHKAEAEISILAENPNAYICRLPLMYGNSYSAGVSFLQPVLKNLNEGMPATLFSDEFRSPASAANVCRGLLLVLEKGAPGIYHLGGPERLSRMEMGERIAAVFGFDKRLLQSRLRSEVIIPAYRPRDLSLESRKMEKLGWKPGTMREELVKIHES